MTIKQNIEYPIEARTRRSTNATSNAKETRIEHISNDSRHVEYENKKINEACQACETYNESQTVQEQSCVNKICRINIKRKTAITRTTIYS